MFIQERGLGFGVFGVVHLSEVFQCGIVEALEERLSSKRTLIAHDEAPLVDVGEIVALVVVKPEGHLAKVSLLRARLALLGALLQQANPLGAAFYTSIPWQSLRVEK